MVDTGNMTMDIVEASKSPNDKKQYRLLQLPNKLQVLLISATSDSSKQGETSDDDMKAYSSDDDEEDDLGDEENEHDSVFGEDDDDQGKQNRRTGACLTVGVGSFAEPEEFPGLAHYLEHMLFMGERYLTTT
jgi:nardilysin